MDDFLKKYGTDSPNYYDHPQISKSKLRKSDLEYAGLDISLAFAKWLIKIEEWLPLTLGEGAPDLFSPTEFKEDICLGIYDLDALHKEYRSEPVIEDYKVRGYYYTRKVGGGGRLVKTCFRAVLRGDWILFTDGTRKSAKGNDICWATKDDVLSSVTGGRYVDMCRSHRYALKTGGKFRN